MGVPDGETIWAVIDALHAALLEPESEQQLPDLLAERLGTVRS
jgi:hypothetical protein